MRVMRWSEVQPGDMFYIDPATANGDSLSGCTYLVTATTVGGDMNEEHHVTVLLNTGEVGTWRFTLTSTVPDCDLLIRRGGE